MVVVTADHQTSGRGRNKKTWFGDYGKNIYLSMGINHKIVKPKQFQTDYQILGCLAVIDVLNSYKKDTFFLKYPNDIYGLDKGLPKKLSGVLVENSYIGSTLSNTIIGIGINCDQMNFPEELTDHATSLRLLGIKYDIEKLKEKVIEKLEYYLGEVDVFDIWMNKLNINGNQVTVTGKSGKWRVESIQRDGRLKLNQSDEFVFIDNGDSIRYDLR